MSHTKILLAEDDRNLGMILKAFLESKGYSTTLCMNGEEAWHTLSTADFDLCITDVVMPIMDGFTLAKQIKSVRPMMPIIILTAKKEQEDVLEGFSIGVEDYVTKPFSMDELLARIKVWERWCAYIQVKAQPSLFHLGSYTFDAPRHLLINGKETKKLTSKEADLATPWSAPRPCNRFGKRRTTSTPAQWTSISPNSANTSRTTRASTSKTFTAWDLSSW